MRTSLVTFAAALCLSSVLAACGGGGGGGGIPATPSPKLSPTPSPTPSSQTSTVAVNAAPTTAPIPAVAGFSGTISLPSSNAGSNTTITATSTTVAPSGVPPLSSALRAATATTTSPTVYLFESFTASSTVTFNGAPGFTLTLPSSIGTAGQSFYMALLVPGSTQWQMAVEGPAEVSGQTLTFPEQSGPTVTLTQGQTYWFAFYSLPAATPAPTATPTSAPTATPTSAPTATPTSAPTATPTATPTPAALEACTWGIPGASYSGGPGSSGPFCGSAANLQFLGTGTQNMELLQAQGGVPPYTVGSFDTAVISSAVDTVNGGWDITPIAAGTTSITITDSTGTSVTVPVSVTITSGVIQ